MRLEGALGGLDRVLVVEEKRGLIESQAKELLYHLPQPAPASRASPTCAGAPLLPSHGNLSSNQVAIAIAERLLERRDDPALRARLEELQRAEQAAAGYVPALARLPYFCPGCPHSSSTHVPEGSKALAGIGCHFMVQWMDRDTRRFTQMGGEGASWLGEAPFSTRPHIFQNVGDGTFYHSGSLAIRAAKASGANITFKILYNDAVAMTGGQKMETGNLDVPAITRLLEAEGVSEIAVVTDEPGKYPLGAGFAPGVRVHPRSELDAVQRRLREVPGRLRSGLRPDLRRREAPPPQARRPIPIPTSASSSTSWSARAAATAASPATASRSSPPRPSSAASGGSTSRPATRISAA